MNKTEKKNENENQFGNIEMDMFIFTLYALCATNSKN